MGTIFIVAPDAPPEETEQLKPQRSLGSGGIRLGLLDNSKANADHLLDLIVEGVKKELKVDSIVYRRKPASSAPATEQILDELAQEADLVVSAMAD
ncbi:MAG: UGSC family (seleno)protein [Burkholderiales bacterium]